MVATEDGLEQLLNFLRSIGREEFQRFLERENLIVRLTEFLQKECEGDHDQEVDWGIGYDLSSA